MGFGERTGRVNIAAWHTSEAADTMDWDRWFPPSQHFGIGYALHVVLVSRTTKLGMHRKAKFVDEERV